MASHFVFSFLMLFTGAIVILGGPPTNVPRHYLVRRDFFNVLKAGEFSVMDPNEKQLYYRLESNYHLLQRVEIFRYPEKKKTGRLSSKLHMLTYKGQFSVLDEKRNEWIEGEMDQDFRLIQNSFNTRWQGHTISMTNDPGAITQRFRDESGELLAEFRLQLSSIFWRKKYDLKIFSNKYPEEIYLLALAAHDHQVSPKGRG